MRITLELDDDLTSHDATLAVRAALLFYTKEEIARERKRSGVLYSTPPDAIPALHMLVWGDKNHIRVDARRESA